MSQLDLERLDEGADDLGAWPDATNDLDHSSLWEERGSEQDRRCRDKGRRERADERSARAALYQRTGLVEAAPQHPPTTRSAPRGSSRRGA